MSCTARDSGPVDLTVTQMISSSLELSKSSGKQDTLLTFVCDKKLRTKDVCQYWIKLYMGCKQEALAQFMQLVLEASGSQYQLPKNLKLPFDYNNIRIAATAYFSNKSMSYPLIMKTSNSLANDIGVFVQHLLRLASTTSIILDDCFLKNITSCIMSLADSKVRAFRHTSTLIALKMMTALSALEDEKLKDIWMQMFANVFLERSNDVVADIRHLCIIECGIWLDKYPQCFLNQVHVKHLFEGLQDNSRHVSQASLLALLRLYNNPSLRSVCLEQGAKFRMTLLGLTMSGDSEIGQMAIQLLVKFYKASPQLLSEAMLAIIEQLVFAAHRGVAQAAAELVPYRYQQASTERERIHELVKFFVKFGEHEHAAYFVDAFYGHNDIMLSWSTMLSMLLNPDTLSSEETSALIEIMTRAVKQAVTGEVPAGRYTHDLVRQPRPNAKKLATNILLSNLRTLLRLYCQRSHDLKNLLELPQYMLFVKAPFQELLEQIKDIMFEQENISVLQVGATTLEHMYGLDPAAFSNHRQQLLNNAVTNFRIAAHAWDDVGSPRTSSNDNYKRMLVTLRLLSALYDRFDLVAWQLSNTVMWTLKEAIRGQPEINVTCPPAEAVDLYLTVFYVAVSWDLKRIQDEAKAGEDVDEDCQELRERVEAFFHVTFTLIEHSSDINIGCCAFVFTCDLFVLFADTLRGSSNKSVRTLAYKSQIWEHERLESFLQRHVFDSMFENDTFELIDPAMASELYSKRRVLSGYLKLVFHNVIPMMRSCTIFQYYERYNPFFGDLMRATLERMSSINPTNFGMTVLHTCLLVYKRIRSAYEDSSQAAASPDFARLIKLAKLLAEMFNCSPLEVRRGILIVHRAGIRFATEFMSTTLKDLLYLKVIEQFVPQLLAQDMLDVLKSLKLIYQETLSDANADELQPLLAYRGCLEIALRQSCRRNDLPKYLE